MFRESITIEIDPIKNNDEEGGQINEDVANEESNMEPPTTNSSADPPAYQDVKRKPPYTAESAKILGAIRMLNTCLLNAVEDLDNVEVERLLAAGANPNATCRMTRLSAVHLAAISNADALQLLLKNRAIKHREDKFGRTPLVLAAWTGATRQIAILLGLSEELQTKVMQGMTSETETEVEREIQANSMIRETSVDEALEVMDTWKDSIEHKCMGFKKELPAFEREWSPLHVASFAAHHRCVRLLLAAGADPNIKERYGRTCLDLAGFSTFQNFDIKEEDFTETVYTLLRFGGSLNTEKIVEFDSVLHTAVKIGSTAPLPLLLSAGAPLYHQNLQGFTPIHECVRTKQKEPLQILANHNGPTQTCLAVNIQDKFGSSVLQLAVGHRWAPGVCMAVQAGADVTLADHKGNNAIHLAGSVGDLEVLKEVLNAALNIDAINKENIYGETPLILAIYSRHVDCVRYLLEEGASLKVTCLEKLINNTNKSKSTLDDSKQGQDILHVATSVGSINILEVLMDYSQQNPNELDLNALLYYAVPCLDNMIPLEYAVEKNHFEAFQFLLENTLNDNPAHNYDITLRLIDIIAKLNRREFFDYICELDKNIVHQVITNGYSLHKAVVNHSRDMVLATIQAGADLSTKNENDQTALNLIMRHIFKPTEFLETIFNMYINSNNMNMFARDYEIVIDYSVLMPGDDEDKPKLEQMNVLEALLETGNSKGQRNLLAHPLIESFLYLKWKTLSYLIYIIILFNALFLISVNTYIVSVYHYRDSYNKTGINKDSVYIPMYYDPNVWKFVIYSTVWMIAVQEIFFIDLRRFQCILELHFWTKSGTIALAIATPNIINMDSPESEWKRNIATLTVFLSWLNMLFLLSWMPTCGFYMQMFGKVSLKVIKITLCFSFLVVCFSICFMIQFKSIEPFEDPISAFFKTMVMMTSEFDYGSIFYREKGSAFMLMQRIVFLCFLVFIAIVLMNLMVGVAVNDLQVLTHKGNLRRLEKQVTCLCMIEAFLNIGFFHYLFKSCRKKVDKIVRIRPNQNEWYLYSGNIREVIINMAEEKRTKINMEEVFNRAENKIEDTNKLCHNVGENDDENCKKINDLVKQTVNEAVAGLRNEIDSKLDATNQMLRTLLEKMNN